MIIKHSWRSSAERGRAALTTAWADAADQPAEHRAAYVAGIYQSIAEHALDLVDTLIKAADAEEEPEQTSALREAQAAYLRDVEALRATD